jgi:demethylmenaquinone methyltransferase / 2-methoxy-6-polyprenyl-1,4-benzoquinol methylase
MTDSPAIRTRVPKEQVETMFNGIAPRYDFLNHFLSIGIDKLWRKRLIKMIAEQKPHRILDLATGTGDLAIAAAQLNPDMIIGTDIATEMIAIGQKKIEKRSLSGKIKLIQADSENLPFQEATFDTAMVAFGVRNYENLSKGLSEMNRVLTKKGRAFILEFSNPSQFPVKQLYHFYFLNILPWIGRMVSKHGSAYTYLPKSVNAFPQGEEFVRFLKEAGFKNIIFKQLSFGIATIYTGEKAG